jgi:hypothetical protein
MGVNERAKAALNNREARGGEGGWCAQIQREVTHSLVLARPGPSARVIDGGPQPLLYVSSFFAEKQHHGKLHD